MNVWNDLIHNVSMLGGTSEYIYSDDISDSKQTDVIQKIWEYIFKRSELNIRSAITYGLRIDICTYAYIQCLIATNETS